MNNGSCFEILVYIFGTTESPFGVDLVKRSTQILSHSAVYVDLLLKCTHFPVDTINWCF